MRRAFSRIETWLVVAAAIAFLVVLPALNAFTPEQSALHVSDFTINLYGKYLCYAVLAVSRTGTSASPSRTSSRR